MTNVKQSSIASVATILKSVLLLCIVSILSLSASAQNRTITGTVTDENNAPLVAATVEQSGSNKTKTKADGTFSISVPAGAKTLSVTYVGYGRKLVNIATQSDVKVQLSVNAKKDDEEIVVVGYQIRKKREEGGAISSVKGKQIQNLPNVSVDRALQGRAAGVLVQGNNGIPGGAINVRIRGNATFGTSTQPLYVVDGVQINNRVDGAFTQNNPLAFLNPNDIESIDVLKDAASSAIYGSQAANGVVIITTKKGKSGKTKFTAGFNTGFASPIKKFDMLTSREYINARAEADFNRFAPQARSAGVAYPFLESQRWALGEISSATLLPYTRAGFAAGQAGVYQASSFSQTQVDSMMGRLLNTNWLDESLQTGITQNIDVNMSGGNDKTSFFVSANITKQNTIFKKVDFSRYGLNADITHRPNSKIQIGTKLNVSTFDQKIPFATDGSFLGNPAFSAPLILPVNPIKNPDGSYFGLPTSQALAGVLNQNIIAVNDFNSGNQRTNQMIGSFTLDYKIANWISYRGFASMDYRLSQGKQYRDPRTNDGIGVRGRGTVQSNWNTNILTTQQLNFNAKITEKLKFDALAAYEYRSDINESISAAGTGFPSSDFVTINAAATPESVGEFYTGYKRARVFGRANFNYDGKYILSLIASRDGSSRFGANNKFGNFGSFIATWNIDKENFLKNSRVLSQLRLRLSAGEVGDDGIGNFDALSLYGSGSQFNGLAGINYGGLPNPNLKWQRNNTTNIGVDYGFYNNRITGSIEAYNRLTKDAILTRPVGWVNGTGGYAENVGQISVKGLEASVNVEIIRPVKEGGFSWSANFNFSYQYNTIKQLYGGLNFLPGDPRIRVGRSNNSVFTQKYEGVNPATGRPMYLDTFSNITYLPQLRDRRYIGDEEPDYFGGLGTVISYKGFGLDVLFNYEYGRLATDGQVNFMIENGNRQFNTLRVAYENRWQKPGDITSYPRIFDTGVEPGGVNHASASSRLWRKADYIRMRDVKLSYTVPSKTLSRLKLGSAVFYVQGQNLFTYSDWLGYDPEYVGSATGIIPQTKNINVGIQIGF